MQENFSMSGAFLVLLAIIIWTMSGAFLALLAIIMWIIFKLLNAASQPEKPSIYFKDEEFMETIMKCSPNISKIYTPTRLWGFSGHIQTAVHSLIGRVKCPLPTGERITLHLEDGSTSTYDMYQPLDVHHLESSASGGGFTLVICPGICNSSESVYIRTFVFHAQCKGYRCVVLNHLGTLKSIPVTGQRIFSYGDAVDYSAMINSVLQRHSSTSLILVGFSMGGNIVTRYLGDKAFTKPAEVVGGISVCQGYDAARATELLLKWTNFRRVYLYVMTENMKRLVMSYSDMLLSDEVRRKYHLSEREIVTAATLPEFDEAYSRRVLGYNSLVDFYTSASSVNYFHNLSHPMVFLNALDDPIVPEPLLECIRNHASTNNNILHIETCHGGHLGFYQGGFIYPNPITWLDETLVELSDGLLVTRFQKKGAVTDSEQSDSELVTVE